MLGALIVHEKESLAQILAAVADMPKEKKEALVDALRMVMGTFTDPDKSGVLIVVDDKERSMITMGLNVSYYEASQIVTASARSVFEQDKDMDNGETRH
jgi:hypothetical protein